MESKSQIQGRRIQLAHLFVILACMVPWGVTAESEPPLPTWDEVSPVMPGGHLGDLLPAGPQAGNLPENALPPWQESPLQMQEEGGLSASDLQLFLRGERAPDAGATVTPTPVLALKTVPETALSGLVSHPLNEGLMDPQNLVPELVGQDLQRLLEFHNAESRVSLYVLVLDRDQKLEGNAGLEAFYRRVPASAAVCLAVYPLGEPWRARLLVARGIQKAASPAALAEMAEDCIRDSMQVNQAAQQLQRYVVRLSTRLFWLEKSLTPGPAQITDETAGVEDSPSLAEVAPSRDKMPSPVQVGVGEKAGAAAWLGGALGGVAALILGGSMWLGWQRFKNRAQTRKVWLLPESESPSRLGGAFSGGAGISIRFGGPKR